jgi:TPR repeat protein
MTTCPKCGYERKPQESVPDWQCPRCGIAYAKAAGSSTPPAAERSARRTHEPEPLYAEPGLNFKPILVGLVILACAGFGVWKYLHQRVPGSAADIAAQFDQARNDLEHNDFVAARKEFTALAETGNAKAQLYLARMYTTSYSLETAAKIIREPADPEKAIYWYKKAADQGEELAKEELAQMYSTGGGKTRPDHEQALALNQEMADKGDARAQYAVGEAYARGSGVSRDLAQAAVWYTKAADQGSARAQYRLALMYAKGEGVKRNPTLAFALMTLSAEGSTREPGTGEIMAKPTVAAWEKQLGPIERNDGKAQAELFRGGRSLPSPAPN